MYSLKKGFDNVSIKTRTVIWWNRYLPIDLKTKIVDKILASITPPNTSIDALWIKEANKRKNEIETDSVSLVNGDEVFQKIAKRLNS